MEKNDFMPSSEELHESIHSRDSIGAFSKNQLDNLKISFIASNDLTSVKETRDDGRTGNIEIEISHGKDNCNINLDIYTAKNIETHTVETVTPGSQPIAKGDGYIPDKSKPIIAEKKGERTDVARIGCTKEIFEFSGMNFEASIDTGAYIEGTGDFGGESIQNKVHEERGLNEVTLPQSQETSSTMGLIAGIEAKKYVLGESLYFTTNIDGTIGFDGTGQLSFTLDIGGVTKLFKWNIWLEAGTFKLGNNIVIQNAIQNDGRYERVGLGIEKQIGSIDIGLHFTQDHINDLKDELQLRIGKKF